MGVILRLTRQNTEVENLFRLAAPGLLVAHFAVGFADDLVGRGVEFAIRVELVADAAFCPEGQHCRALIAQGIGMLVPAKLAPCRVEFSAHAEKIERQVVGILGRHGEVVVTPAPGWQRLQFEVADI